jgi:hypothetical protein
VAVALEEEGAVEGRELQAVDDGGGVVGQHGGDPEAGQRRWGQRCVWVGDFGLCLVEW